jgi:hypothetical protein
MEKYFSTHRNYFIAVATATNNVGAASLKEKEMVARYVKRVVFYKIRKLSEVQVHTLYKWQTPHTFESFLTSLPFHAVS